MINTIEARDKKSMYRILECPAGYKIIQYKTEGDMWEPVDQLVGDTIYLEWWAVMDGLIDLLKGPTSLDATSPLS